ncbi:MAG: S41 family peptidase [Chitinophagales bacterium]|nr:S41 family peptidase [Chitinophagales bacterium]
MKLRHWCILLSMFYFVSLNSQNLDSIRNQAFYSEILNIIQNHSIVSDSIKWTPFRKEIEFLVSSYPKDSGRVIILRIINELRKYGDNHSSWRSRKREMERLKMSDSLKVPHLIEVKKGIVQLIIPSYTQNNDLDQYRYLDSALRQIEKYDTKSNIKGLIVDLRGNGGGNMYPMIACILPFIELDSLGYFIKKNTKTSWYAIFQENKMPINRVRPYKCKTLDLKIAVLIDSKTGSAAEMTAISLIGKNNVKLLGQPSSGLVTANKRFKLSNGSILALAVAWCADRNGRVYKDRLEPDIRVKNEDIIREALNWIEE